MAPESDRRDVIALVHLPPPLHGAAAVSEQLIRSEVINERFDVTVVPIQLSASLGDIGGISAAKLRAVLRNFRAVGRALRRRPQLIYFTLPPHGGGFFASLPLVWLAKRSRAPILYHFHGKGIAAAAEGSRLYRTLFRWAVRGSHYVLLSERLFADASAFLEREQTHFIPNAGAEPLSAAATAGRSGQHILFLSNLVLSKGPLILLDALALLKRRGRAFRATFAGAPYPPLDADSFQARLKAAQLTDEVSYVGPTFGAGKRDLLASADIFAFPSLNDAFPLVVTEAMAAGLAVVATPEGAIPDMVEDGVTGIMVPHRDPVALADALDRLLADRELCREMGAAGQARIATEFSKDKFFERMVGLWSHLADASAPILPTIKRRKLL